MRRAKGLGLRAAAIALALAAAQIEAQRKALHEGEKLAALGALLATAPMARAQGRPAPATPATGDVAGLVDVGGHQLFLECQGTGSPTVVLEAGYRSPLDFWTDDLIQPDAPRTIVLPGVGAFTHVCA
jgi:hypothetical protein